MELHELLNIQFKKVVYVHSWPRIPEEGEGSTPRGMVIWPRCREQDIQFCL